MPPPTPADDLPALPPDDLGRMRQALSLAERAIGLTEPNPRVGCVIVSADGRRIGAGHTQQAGGPHAEIVALRAAEAAGHDLRGATVYVTLEPCAHHGRTPPCCDALIAAGVGRVVAAIVDPYPVVAGRGLEQLRAAGIAVEAGLCAEEARELNLGFFSRVQRGRPWVRLKIAGSLDGRTALDNGVSQWITGDAARADGHAWRRRAGAVLTGVGTLLEDDPRLDVRLVPTARQPMRVVIDSRLEMPLGARLLTPPGEVLVYGAVPQDERVAALRAAGAEVKLLPSANGKVDLARMLEDLAVRGINELHVEAGAKLNGSLLREGLVDELLVYVAPMLIGEGRGLAALGPHTTLDAALRYEWQSVDRIGGDLRLRARAAGRDRF